MLAVIVPMRTVGSPPAWLRFRSGQAGGDVVRGKLRIYLGSAPGVGKTFAMLDEGWRRRERGTDVVIGLVVTHGRAKTIAQIRDLEVVAPRRIEYRGSLWTELDVD